MKLFEKYKLICTFSFALFAMFFGAGNLVFPLKVGYVLGKYWTYGFWGLVITAIIMPFCGLLAVKKHHGDYNAFFGGAGSFAKLVLPFCILAIIASFAAIPRCITVAYGGIHTVMPHLSLGAFGFIFCIAAFFVCLNEQRIIDVVGKWMAPILLIFLFILVIKGITNIHSANLALVHTTSSKAFCEGFLTGYQTMDLLAAFFFAAFIFAQLRKILSPEIPNKKVIKVAVISGILAMSMLAAVYAGMAFLGAKFSDQIIKTSPESVLATITGHLMGNYASWFMGIIITLACFTTVVALNSLYARHLQSLLKFNDHQYKYILLVITIIAYVISLTGFNAIAKFLVPILEISYPALIVLTIISIFSQKQTKFKAILFYGVVLVNIIYKIVK